VSPKVKAPVSVRQLHVRGVIVIVILSVAASILLSIATGDSSRSMRLVYIDGGFAILGWMLWVSTANKTAQEMVKGAQYYSFSVANPDGILVDQNTYWRVSLVMSAQLAERHKRETGLVWLSQRQHNIVGNARLVLGSMAEVLVALLFVVWLAFANSDLPFEGFNHWPVTTIFLVALLAIPIVTSVYYWKWKYRYFVVTTKQVGLVTVPPMWLLPIISPTLTFFDLSKINIVGHEKPRAYIWTGVDAEIVMIDIIGNQDRAFNALTWMPEGAHCYNAIETAREPYVQQPNPEIRDRLFAKPQPAPVPRDSDTQPIPTTEE